MATKIKVKNAKKKTDKTSNKLLFLLVALLAGAAVGAGITVNINNNGQMSVEPTFTIELSEEQIPAVIEDDMGELVENDNIPTVEEIDGGKFEDETTGVSVTDGEYTDLGWAETYDTTSAEAFKNDTLGKCIIANNKYGAQCVSLARVFWWSYADRDVSTCGTGAAKGMMNCAEQNAGDEFEVYYGNDEADKIQAGDWLVFDGGLYGHVGMALGPVVNGYVALLGENQGGASCGATIGGSATNIVNISVKKLLGFYRPKAYIKVDPTPEPEPTVESETYTVQVGDTLGGIARKLGWYEGEELYGDTGYAQKLAEANGIENRGLIYPGQVITRI